MTPAVLPQVDILQKQQIASLVSQAWRTSPAATAVRWSQGQWGRQPHLNLISDAVASIAEKPLRLIVSMPPRHGKSQLLSHWTPIWFLANWSRGRIGLASYAADFASTWGRQVRDTVAETPGLGISLSRDLTRAHDWELAEGGGMMTAGIGGPFTGRGFDLLIVDDPVKNRAEASSPTIRQHLWDWWTSTARTRLEPGGSIIIVQTRWHEDDLVGRLLERTDHDDPFADLDEWQHIRLPALAEEDDSLGRDLDAPLWPLRYDIRALANLRVEVGPQDWAGMFQQRPTEQGGGVFRFDWWRYASPLPEPTDEVIQFWDTAFKEGQENDYSACATMYPAENCYPLQDMWRGRLEFPDLVKQVIIQAERFGPSRIYIEDAASGQSLIQALRNETRLPIIAVKVDSSKISRANAVTGQVEAGNVVLPPRAPWLDDFLDEMTAFPGTFDDQVDAFVGCLTQLAVKPQWSVVIPDC